MSPKPRKRGKPWSQASERALISVWDDKIRDLCSSRRTRNILEEMVVDLKKQGLSFSVGELKSKMHNMKSRYRKDKLNFEKSGEPSEWELFKDMEDLLKNYETYRSENSMHNSDNERKRRIQWNPKVEKILIKLWAEKINELNSMDYNDEIFEEFASMLASMGYPFSVYEVKGKIYNLTNRYRDERRKIAISGGKFSSTWPAFEEIHAILEKHTNFDFENDNSNYKSETSTTEFAFVQSDSLLGSEFLSEDDTLSTNTTENFQTQQKDKLEQNSFTQKEKGKNLDDSAKCSKTENYDSKTVNDVVNFIIKTENNKSRNESFLNVLDSYLLQLPEKIQDQLKMEFLNIVFNKIKDNEENVENSF